MNGTAAGQSIDSLRAAYRLPVPARAVVPLPGAAPSMGANTPSAFGAGWGDAYVGASAANRSRWVTQPDLAVAAGVGLGDPWRWVGVQATLVSFSTFDAGFGTRAAVDLQVSRVLPGLVGIAFGLEGALNRGINEDEEVKQSRYGVVSKWFQLRERGSFREAMVSVGIGDGRFRTQADWWDRRETWNVFGSAAVRVFEPVSAVIDWTGQDLMVAASVAPFRRHQVVGTIGLAELFGTAGDGVRLVASGSYGFRFVPRR